MYVCCDAYGNYYWVARQHDAVENFLAAMVCVAVAAGIVALVCYVYQEAVAPLFRTSSCSCDDCRRKRGELRPLDSNNLPAEYRSPGQDWPFQ